MSLHAEQYPLTHNSQTILKKKLLVLRRLSFNRFYPSVQDFEKLNLTLSVILQVDFRGPDPNISFFPESSRYLFRRRYNEYNDPISIDYFFFT